MEWWAWATIGAVVVFFLLFIYALCNILSSGDRNEERRPPILRK